MSKKIISGLAAALALLAAAAPAMAQDAMTVVKDKDTGQIRAANADEIAAMKEAQNSLQATKASGRRMAMRQSAPVPLQKFHASGAQGARLTEEMSSSVVMVRNADGTLSKQCFENHGEAEAAVQSGHVHASTKYVTE